MAVEKKDAENKAVSGVRTGPPNDERVDDDRKVDHAGEHHPRPQGAKHGDGHEVELKARAKFLRDNAFRPEADTKTEDGKKK
jgi:hypothetical protein